MDLVINIILFVNLITLFVYLVMSIIVSVLNFKQLKKERKLFSKLFEKEE